MNHPKDRKGSNASLEGGQAATLRDRKRIEELKNKHDLKNPETAFEVYEHFVADPYYFETNLGKQFLRELLKTAIHSDSYLFDEQVISGRMNEQEFQRVEQAVEQEATIAVHAKRRRPKKHTQSEFKIEKLNRERQGKRTKVIRISLIVLIILMLFIFSRSIYEMIDYQIKSYQSEKKIEELISCILVPVDATVSKEHREDDLLASGLVGNPEEVLNEIEEKRVLYAYSILYERNHDMAGWIKIDDTIINYPVMLTKADEEYYLKRDFDQKDDLCGLPFMDIRCDVTAPTNIYLVYGHNMKNGSMFSSLISYEDYNFYQEHPEIQFDTIYEEGTFEIMSVFQTRVAYQDEDFFRYYEIEIENEKEFNEYVQNTKNLSIYDTGVTTTYGDQLLVLSTCDRRIDNGRFVVVATKVK